MCKGLLNLRHDCFKGIQTGVEKMVRAFEERRDVLVNGLNAIKNIDCRKPKGAFMYSQILELVSQVIANELLERAGVALLFQVLVVLRRLS